MEIYLRFSLSHVWKTDHLGTGKRKRCIRCNCAMWKLHSLLHHCFSELFYPGVQIAGTICCSRL